ncbi:MAG: hypothetical protein HF309_19315, partial [Ignavibacteria bacterium]|nr:hypothetical protein [Ignavibacteria bacterium]MCU7518528.1 hypothetical protein [Ignavibacteria bacterium]
MKRFLFLASILALGFMFLAPQTTQAQFTQNAATFRSAGELTFTFAGAVDTVGGTNADLTSKAFSLIDYDALSTFTFAQKCTSAKGNPKVTALLKGSEDGTNY